MMCSWIAVITSVDNRFLNAKNLDPEKTISLSVCPSKAVGKNIFVFSLLYIIFQGFFFKIPCFLSICLPTRHIILFYCDMIIVKNNTPFGKILSIFLSLTHKTELLWRPKEGVFLFSLCFHLKALLTNFVFLIHVCIQQLAF